MKLSDVKTTLPPPKRKRCHTCQTIKEGCDFSTDNRKKDRLDSNCRDCNRKKNDLKKTITSKCRYCRKEFFHQKQNPGYFCSKSCNAKGYWIEPAKNHHLQEWAHSQVREAIERGDLIRPDSCSICSQQCKPDGHHEDYAKPLEVVWVCKSCHKNGEMR